MFGRAGDGRAGEHMGWVVFSGHETRCSVSGGLLGLIVMASFSLASILQLDRAGRGHDRSKKGRVEG